MNDENQPRAVFGGETELQSSVIDALDESAADLRTGRTEDARLVLARLQARLDSHLAKKKARAEPAGG